MALPQIQFVQAAADSAITKIQDNIKSWILRLQRFAPIIDGALVTSQQINPTGDTLVRTGLDRAALGYIVVKRSGAGVVFTSPTPNTTPVGTLLLRASAAVTVDLWVF